MSVGDNSARIISHDWTNLFRHRSRQFSMDEFRFAHGVDWVGAAVAAGTAVVVGVGSGTLLWLAGIGWWWLGSLVGVAVGGAAYLAVAKDTEGRVTPLESTTLWIDYHLFQPSMLQGAGTDEYPTDLHWQVLFYRPDDMPEYSDSFPAPAPYGIYRK
ncbi:hypothetical protein SIM91_04890 [Rhodococcus opacus]|uniref:hypothetical protein n=1 Tax=Rhodococcus opacus TaxID=37919 RepID=UPI0002A1BDF9|nr:hypothetical protein [Rhodococcus opacus]ELB94728.1 hypothetical protein Rwratislav_02382 [Rhodococcus wratislaviensis IFP 2016]MDX5962659.1 hypothetical protein [Rhodococcus opacus]CAG7636150.1 hypothetical protein E143388_07763 [Rhodococcus opacus]